MGLKGIQKAFSVSGDEPQGMAPASTVSIGENQALKAKDARGLDILNALQRNDMDKVVNRRDYREGKPRGDPKKIAGHDKAKAVLSASEFG